jgi:hypothetical protein
MGHPRLEGGIVKPRLPLFLGASILLTALVAPAATARSLGSGDSSATDKAALVRYKMSHGYLVGDIARYERLSAQAAARAARLHPRSTGTTSFGAAPIAGPSWQGLDEDDLSPPDPNGSIGPHSYIQTINLQIGIYDRAGALITSAPFSTLTGATDFLSDPQIVFDVRSNRFYYLILRVGSLEAPVSTMLWGFSKSNNPTSIPGGFCNYETDFGWGGTIADYPKLGTTEDFLLIGVNVYPTLATFLESDVGWIIKPVKNRKSITTCPAANTIVSGKQTALLNSDGATLSSTPEPAQQADPTSDGWIVSVPDPTNSGASGTELELYHVTKNPNGTPDIPQVATAVAVSEYSPPAPALQKNGIHPIDTLDGRLTHAVSAIDPNHGSSVALWTGHTIFGGAGAEFRWYEIDVANSTLFQSGDITDPNRFVFNGAIAPDRAVKGKPLSKRFFGGNMVTGFTTSGANDFPAVQMVSKIGSNPTSAFVLLVQSPGPDEGFDCFELGKCRWGDYGGAFPDSSAPSNGSVGKVWLSNMWDNGESDPLAATWRTWNWGATP